MLQNLTGKCFARFRIVSENRSLQDYKLNLTELNGLQIETDLCSSNFLTVASSFLQIRISGINGESGVRLCNSSTMNLITARKSTLLCNILLHCTLKIVN